MLAWFKKHGATLVAALICAGILIYCYACESKIPSLVDKNRSINRQELQLELDQFISMSQLRMADLDRQDALKTIVLQNAMILVQGQPFNPVGIITGVAAIYGLTQGGCNIVKKVKVTRNKGKSNGKTT